MPFGEYMKDLAKEGANDVRQYMRYAFRRR